MDTRNYSVPSQTELSEHYLQKSNRLKSKATKLEEEAKELRGNAQALLDDFNRDYSAYSTLYSQLNSFKEQHCPDQTKLLIHLATVQTFKIINDDYIDESYNETWKFEFFNLLNALVNLSNAIPQDRKSILYEPLCQALSNAILLTENFTQVPIESKEQIQLTKTKIKALTDTIQAAATFGLAPDNEVNSHNLYTATVIMNDIVDPGAFFQEHRLLLTLTAAMATLIGMALVFCPLLIPMTTAASVVYTSLSGWAVFYTGIISFMSITGQPYNEQHPFARDINAPLKSISKNPKPGFFSSRPDEGQSGSSAAHFGMTISTNSIRTFGPQ
ncbi:MAG: hypothetical protein V4501_11955 [Pseudomonadota bacterium]